MKPKRLPIPIFLCLFLTLGAWAQSPFKVIGYLPYYRFDLIDQMELDRLTHLNIAFANPDMTGELDVRGKDIRPIVARAKEKDLIVCISLAGGALLPEWEAAWAHLLKPENRASFVHRIVRFVEDYGLDGVDVDLEWGAVNEKYSPFVLALRDSLSAHNKLMTAALPGTYRYPQISNAALAAYDWINMMAYDLTGPWNPNRPGPHSPFSFASDAIAYWRAQGVPAEKLTLGVPFYGYDFSFNPVLAFTYRSLVEQNPDLAFRDQTGQAYYNGIPTMQAKTRLALGSVGGIMIWEIGQDHFGEYSLLRAIDEVVRGASPVVEVDPAPSFRVYPNPFVDYLEVRNDGKRPLHLQLTDIAGRSVQRLELAAGGTRRLPTGLLPQGIYLLSAGTAQGIRTYKLVK